MRDELKLRGVLARLKCWHRLTGEEAQELVDFCKQRGITGDGRGEAPIDTLRKQMRIVTALTLKNPGQAITLPDLMATEGRKFMRGEPSLFDQLPFAEVQSIGASLDSATPPQQQQAAPVAVPDGWQPIETAPKQEKVLLYSPPENLSGRPGQKPDIRVARAVDFTWATHWMPLPAAPKPQ
jgi:hypothetical protein